ncbi:hypothetical protein PF005_g5627 [Phytophthora fragariae]|uniref:Uncharacterized protein n=1 Tax=Phytophthora fragariae TaxID=53985 RepID=A0A6A3F5A1_9STRA|nr:hypothetical protein PF009_g11238 [Phytophthora fragariae]KAE9088375.1 hypothetical protein PF006_g25595 [Phytophthora fragariae]KAE9126215.1 hypothetical protein PF007_g6053 [Phytophthora fragariae]KAE9220129.1 hypothetical protein PF002_g15986 [Phytophthora fragariae]KAE9225218.1 hypothetical protein PF005_g5627 [Phytophthora fragariae]
MARRSASIACSRTHSTVSARRCPALGLIACPWLSSHSIMRCMLRRASRPFTPMGCATLRCRSHYEAAPGLRS